MSFFRSKASAAAAAKRKTLDRQLVSLQQKLPMALHRDAERRHWEVGLQLQSGTVIVMQIKLPPDFPDVAPTMQLTTACFHPLVGADGCQIVGHKDLQNWGSHMELGRVAGEVIRHLEREPPVPIIDEHGGGGAGAGARPGGGVGGGGRPARQPAAPQVEEEPELHFEVPAVFPAIERATLDGLMFMNGDAPDSKASREYFVTQHEFVSNRIQRRRELRSGCQTLAQKNIALGEQIRHLQEEIQGLDARVEERMQQLRAAVTHQTRLASHFSVDGALQRLEHQKNYMDAASMESSDRFLADREMDADVFCKEFLTQRQAYHEACGMYEQLRTTSGNGAVM